MIKKYSEMKHTAVDPVPADAPAPGAGAPPAGPDAGPSAPSAPASAPSAPSAPAPAPSAPSAPNASPNPDASPAGDDAEVAAAKMKIYLEQQCAELGFSIESVDIRRKNKALSLIISSEGGVVSQKDMVLLAAQLNTNDLAWELMEDCLAAKGGNWQINFSKVK
jgi:hypothetical protein